VVASRNQTLGFDRIRICSFVIIVTLFFIYFSLLLFLCCLLSLQSRKMSASSERDQAVTKAALKSIMEKNNKGFASPANVGPPPSASAATLRVKLKVLLHNLNILEESRVALQNAIAGCNESLSDLFDIVTAAIDSDLEGGDEAKARLIVECVLNVRGEIFLLCSYCSAAGTAHFPGTHTHFLCATDETVTPASNT